MKTIVYGADGVMGKLLIDQIDNSADIEVVAKISPLGKDGIKYLSQYQGDGDVLIDFSHPNNLSDILQWGIKTGKPLVLCTTGYTDNDLKCIEQASIKCPILLAGNTSPGVNILKLVLENMVSLLGDWDIEVVERHHNRKKDSPSGTAREILHILEENNVNKTKPVYGRGLGNTKRSLGDIGIHSIRGGTIAGDHTVIFAGDDEVIEIKHQALSRRIFANGAIKAAKYLLNKNNGFYSMRNIFSNN